jgi:hypothetical protein
MELRASPYTSLLLLVGLTVVVAVARNLGECLSHIDRCCGIMYGINVPRFGHVKGKWKICSK